MTLFTFLLPAVLASAVHTATHPPLQTGFFEQPVDQLSFSSRDTFLQRYLWTDASYSPGGPMIFYAGNEGDINGFAESTGALYTMAAQTGGLVVFGEHRYYGTSLVGNTTFLQRTEDDGDDAVAAANPPYEYLSAPQAIADFAALIVHVKDTLVDGAAKDAAVIAVGGSYGGMLAAWLRLKFPHVVDGGIASSAPLVGSPSLADPGGFYGIVAADFANADGFSRTAGGRSRGDGNGGGDGSCAARIRAGFQEMLEAEKADIAAAFRLCNATSNTVTLVGLLQSYFGVLAELDYPYSVNFIGYSLPPHPVNAACNQLAAAKAAGASSLEQLQAAVSVAYNSSGTVQCLALEPAARFETFYPGFMPGAWTYQRCSEIVLPVAVSEANPMFLRCSEFAQNCWSLDTLASFCNATFGVVPRPTMDINYFFGRNVTGVDQLYLTNGELDPWRSGGYTTSTAKVPSMVLDGAAHHLDLRTQNAADPPDVISARAAHVAFVKQVVKTVAAQAT